MKKKILAGAAAVCAAACMAVTAFAVESTDFYVNNAAQVEGYQSVAYLNALDSLKRAEQEFIKQTAIANSENPIDKSTVGVPRVAPNGGNLPDSITEQDYSLVIGEIEPNSYWKALDALKMADINYKKICTDLGVESNYMSVLDSEDTSISTYISTASSAKRLAIYQVPQERSYWCGYAALKSLLDYEGISMTQKEIAEELYYPDKSCPWYTIYGTQEDQYYIPKYLNKKIDNFRYAPYSPQLAGTSELDASEVQSRIVSTINLGHGIFVGGESYRDWDQEGSRLPGYPASLVRHFIAVDGYKSVGDEIWIVDPAKSDVISWSGSISKYYSVSTEKLASYASAMGIVW